MPRMRLKYRTAEETITLRTRYDDDGYGDAGCEFGLLLLDLARKAELVNAISSLSYALMRVIEDGEGYVAGEGYELELAMLQAIQRFKEWEAAVIQATAQRQPSDVDTGEIDETA